ncbi:glycosyltransferase [Qingshengfaniella alkalisoli]|uniref:Glycosyltransferase family 4 protein n=1 Tax=Qingshengfaniella alkalisoli TaxID=2599296 RepID=A0A5B8JBG3_9RHOB|nr:glycosyltransferase [Qingshengfaniella alkalisoli]QDY71617.1 glycosyltransferase family 4 protein [Qingshengfaniella alkalisoli]
MAKIVVFGFDLTEASQVRRIRSLRKLGHDVSSLTFRRGNMNADFQPEWNNTDLGYAPNESYGKRIAALLRAIPRMAGAREQIAAADLIIARNFDLLFLAHLARRRFGVGDTPLVYECLDIHGLFTRTDQIGRAMRYLERKLLARTQLLVVSSPGFVENYFRPTQGYTGPVSIVENKLWFDGQKPARPMHPSRVVGDGPLVLGWVGSIRCAPSLKILAETAKRMGTDLQIKIHGNIHRHALPEFDKTIGDLPNVEVFGPYSYPGDLAQIYSSCDLVWAQDLWQRGANSDWLLPNRIYEASWFGCPSVAVADTQTGKHVVDGEMGLTIPEATSDALVQLLHGLEPEQTQAMAAALLAKDARRFELHAEDLTTALNPVLPFKSKVA